MLKNQEVYDALVAQVDEIERKGKTVPYTSANGYMFSLLNKEGEIGIRLSKESQQQFKEKHDADIFHSHGAVMRDYVKVPESLFGDLQLLADYLKESHAFVLSLPPK